MEQSESGADLLHWLPTAAIWIQGETVVAANSHAVAVLGTTDQMLERIHTQDLRVLLSRVAGFEQSGDQPSDPEVLVRVGQAPLGRYIEFRLGAHPSGGVLAMVRDVSERERLDAAIAEFATGVFTTDGDLEVTWIPKRVSASVGLPLERFVGTSTFDLVHPDDHVATHELLDRAKSMSGVRCSRRLRVRLLDQPEVWWPVVVHAIWRGDDPAIGGLLIRFDMDVAGGADLREAEHTAQALVTLSPTSTTGSLHLDLAGTLLQRSTRVREILRSLGDDGDQMWQEWLRPGDKEAVNERIAGAALGSLMPPAEVGFQLGDTVVWARLDVMPYRDSEGHVVGMFVNIADHTDEREARNQLAAAREELWHLANHDALTGLANRYQLAKRLLAALSNDDFAGSVRKTAIIVCDLDRFKEVNDRHGHRVGDEVLVEATRRISSAVDPGDLVCRFGGDEFVVLSENVRSNKDLESRVQRLYQSFDSVFVVDGLTFDIGISIGSAVSEPTDLQDPGQLILRADREMYAAKALGKDLGR